MGIQGQGDDCLHLGGSHFSKCLFCEGVPVAHAWPDHEVSIIMESLLKCPGLFLSFFPYGRPPADALVIRPAFRSPTVGDEPGNGFLQESGAQTDDLPVGEQIDQKRAHVFKTPRAAQI